MWQVPSARASRRGPRGVRWASVSAGSPRARPREALLPAPWVAFRDLWGRCPCGPAWIPPGWGGVPFPPAPSPAPRLGVWGGCGVRGDQNLGAASRRLPGRRFSLCFASRFWGTGESRQVFTPPLFHRIPRQRIWVSFPRGPRGDTRLCPFPPPPTSFCLISRPASGFRPVGVRCSSLTGHCPDSPAFPSPWSLRRLGQRYVCQVEYSETAIEQLVTHTGHSLAPPPGLKVHSFHH